jgi:carbonic anhydrase
MDRKIVDPGNVCPEEKTMGECEWSYHGSNGPNQWGTMTNAQSDLCYPYCSATTWQQSPIAIITAEAVYYSGLSEPKFKYERTRVSVGKLYHNFPITYPSGSNYSNTLTYNGITYNLTNIHCHHPSEHTWNASATNAGTTKIELHMVHTAQVGNPPQTQTLVVAIFYEPPGSSEEGKIVNQIVYNIDGSFHLDASTLIPDDITYFTYLGSLTTPGCNPNVNWLLMHNVRPIDGDYVQDFKSALENDYGYGYNARPVQVQLTGTNGTQVYTNFDPNP